MISIRAVLVIIVIIQTIYQLHLVPIKIINLVSSNNNNILHTRLTILVVQNMKMKTTLNLGLVQDKTKKIKN